MSSQSIAQQTWDDVIVRNARIAGQHAAYDLMLWLYETRPELVEEERVNRARLEKPDALAVLNAAWMRGSLTEEEYRTIYNRLNRAHGEWCACGRGQAVYTHPETGTHLCGACALPLVQS